MNDLYRLVYTSRNLVTGEADAGERSTARIVESSRRNNGPAGVTGALLFSAGSFAQVLEGPRAAVEATFERIQRDPRHGDISVLQCEFVAERVFSDWSMAFVGRSARGIALWDNLARSTGFDLGRIEGNGFCAALLAKVRADEAAAAAPPVRQPTRLDVERLRSALDAERPERRGAPVPAPEGRADRPAGPPALPAPPPSATAPAEARVLRTALDEERERTTALRRALDEARIALATAEGEVEGLGRHRDIWADRSSQLRTGLAAARDALQAAEGERDALRARVASQDGAFDALRLSRDIWAERARALATALCRDPAVPRDEGLTTGAARPALERGRPPLAKVAN